MDNKKLLKMYNLSEYSVENNLYNSNFKTKKQKERLMDFVSFIVNYKSINIEDYSISEYIKLKSGICDYDYTCEIAERALAFDKLIRTDNYKLWGKGKSYMFTGYPYYTKDRNILVQIYKDENISPCAIIDQNGDVKEVFRGLNNGVPIPIIREYK